MGLNMALLGCSLLVVVLVSSWFPLRKGDTHMRVHTKTEGQCCGHEGHFVVETRFLLEHGWYPVPSPLT
jgi:hypothetical protein